jgi:hypothetical protein
MLQCLAHLSNLTPGSRHCVVRPDTRDYLASRGRCLLGQGHFGALRGHLVVGDRSLHSNAIRPAVGYGTTPPGAIATANIVLPLVADTEWGLPPFCPDCMHAAVATSNYRMKLTRLRPSVLFSRTLGGASRSLA